MWVGCGGVNRCCSNELFEADEVREVVAGEPGFGIGAELAYRSEVFRLLEFGDELFPSGGRDARDVDIVEFFAVHGEGASFFLADFPHQAGWIEVGHRPYSKG